MSHYDVLDAIDRIRKVLKTEKITPEQYGDLLRIVQSAKIDDSTEVCCTVFDPDSLHLQTSRLILTPDGVFLRNQATRDRAIADFATSIVESDHP